jgi:ribosome maturation factor RimP
MHDVDTGRIIQEISPVIEGMGYQLVELKLGRSKKLDDITVVIYKAAGISLDDCTRVSRNILPRLELLDNLENLALKVTSPGITRVFKGINEYRIFIGKGVKVLLADTGEWIGGIIHSVTENILTIIKDDKEMNINFDNIKKAKLDYTEEVGNK